MSKIIFITGATSGIGEACVRVFAAAGYKVLFCGRRMDRLKRLQQELREEFHHDIMGIQLDVRDQPLVEKTINELPDAWKNIDILINNAGLALGLSEIEEGDLNDWEEMIDTNVKGLLYVSRAVIPGMKDRRSGHIINIGSIAGRETYPKGNVYCATKFAVDAISKGMRMDLVSYGIKVCQISPGAVNTEFSTVRFHGDSKRANEVYRGITPLTAEDVAQTVFFVASTPPNVNIDDILLTPLNQASATIFHRDTQV